MAREKLLRDTAAGRWMLTNPKAAPVGFLPTDTEAVVGAKILKITREQHPDLEATFWAKVPERIKQPILDEYAKMTEVR